MQKRSKQKTIFDLERRMDPFEEIEDIQIHLENTQVACKSYESLTVMALINRAIQTWPYREGDSTISAYLDKRGIKFDLKSDEGVSIDDVYYTLELYLNLLYWAPEYDRNRVTLTEFDFGGTSLRESLQQYIEDIVYFFEQCNMTVRKRKGKKDFPQYVVTKRDAAVDATIEQAPEISEILLSYLDIRNAKDEEFKKKAIRDIADYLEPKRKYYNGTAYKGLCESLFYAFNTFDIRHNNEKQKKLRKPQRMELYDKLFQMSLHLIQSEQIKEYKDQIDGYKQT